MTVPNVRRLLVLKQVTERFAAQSVAASTAGDVPRSVRTRRLLDVDWQASTVDEAGGA